jgi:hypothetical protein
MLQGNENKTKLSVFKWRQEIEYSFRTKYVSQNCSSGSGWGESLSVNVQFDIIHATSVTAVRGWTLITTQCYWVVTIGLLKFNSVILVLRVDRKISANHIYRTMIFTAEWSVSYWWLYKNML